ncbi:Zinc-finger domain-containing protein [Frankia sp. AiPs1]|nr:zf-HC2 domain-containing protein [Frankia sp. AiPa1]
MTEHLGDRISPLIDHQLDHDARDRAFAHLAGCSTCQHEVARMRRLKAQLVALRDPMMSDAFVARLRDLGAVSPVARAGGHGRSRPPGRPLIQPMTRSGFLGHGAQSSTLAPVPPAPVPVEPPPGAPARQGQAEVSARQADPRSPLAAQSLSPSASLPRLSGPMPESMTPQGAGPVVEAGPAAEAGPARPLGARPLGARPDPIVASRSGVPRMRADRLIGPGRSAVPPRPAPRRGPGRDGVSRTGPRGRPRRRLPSRPTGFRGSAVRRTLLGSAALLVLAMTGTAVGDGGGSARQGPVAVPTVSSVVAPGPPAGSSLRLIPMFTPMRVSFRR